MITMILLLIILLLACMLFLMHRRHIKMLDRLDLMLDAAIETNFWNLSLPKADYQKPKQKCTVICPPARHLLRK